jgi:hypothetical protein
VCCALLLAGDVGRENVDEVAVRDHEHRCGRVELSSHGVDCDVAVADDRCGEIDERAPERDVEVVVGSIVRVEVVRRPDDAPAEFAGQSELVDEVVHAALGLVAARRIGVFVARPVPVHHVKLHRISTQP